MIRRNLIKLFLIGVCMSAFSSTAAFAATVEKDQAINASVKENVNVSVQENEDKLFVKQQEIDQYLFEEHAKDIANKGFQVTSTVVIEDYVEIGITPYSEENADYLYQIFGKETVKVVKGEQAVILDSEVVSTKAPDTAVSDSDKEDTAITGKVYKTDDATKAAESGMAVTEVDASKAAESGMAITDVDASKAAESGMAVTEVDASKAAEMEITNADVVNATAADNSAVDPEMLAYTTGAAAAESETSSMLPVILLGVAGMALIIGGTAFWIKKRKNFMQ